MVLMLGKIDDLSEVYFNGTRIGRVGNLDSESPEIQGDEWQVVRAYYVPQELIRPGETNLIAVRVFDSYRDGGIFEGPLGWVTASVYQEMQE